MFSKEIQAIENAAGRIAAPLERANFSSEVQEYKNEYIKFLKHAITFTNPSSISPQEMWGKILLSNSKSQTTLRNLTGLMESLLILPSTNSQLERFFSFMGNIKTDWRCGLKEETVEALARITLKVLILKNGRLFEHQMLLNIGINKKTAELSNRKENLTKNFSSIMSISYFMGKTFVFLRKSVGPSKVMTMVIMIKIMV